MKILIADDEPALLHLLKTNLELEGHETITVSNGRAALEVIQRQSPDIVLLDVMMPVMDGLQVLAYVAERDLPTRIILVSARVQDEAQLQGWELGCDEYITKPFDLESLLDRIQEVGARSGEATERRRAEAIAELRSGNLSRRVHSQS